MTRFLGTLAALVQDPGSVPSTHMPAKRSLTPVPRLLLPSLRHTCRGNTNEHKINYFKELNRKGRVLQLTCKTGLGWLLWVWGEVP